MYQPWKEGEKEKKKCVPAARVGKWKPEIIENRSKSNIARIEKAGAPYDLSNKTTLREKIKA